ncbi:hypothetical protein [Listeria grayi]|uniref:Uncharacterized protein n=3 Tax=Listeria grayi TaxID=1641 RepID=D7UXE4_LISGR|nr:hypothetical protein [Listeria grayi]EFI84352.1 hypothetical protein HMPREF0556_10905 [Listeria grayi DSM 20601]EUJ26197.1 hypothetical protein LMUR_13374 [Listeria grayi FSL F6-1183]STY45413.1 Uncharacterised protein [Listeria grayi]
MRIFCGILSIQTGVISWVAEYLTKGENTSLNLIGYSTKLTHITSYSLTVGMILAGILMLLARKSMFLISLSILIWSFSLIFGILFVPTYTGIYFRPIVSLVCLVIALFIYAKYARQ